MSLEAVLTLIALLAGVVSVVLFHRKWKNERPDVVVIEKLTTDKLFNDVKVELVDIIKKETPFGKNDEEWEAAYKRKKRLKAAMKDCTYGIEADKIIIKDLIRGVVKTHLPTEEAIAELIDLNGVYVEPMVKQEIFMCFLKKKYKEDAMSYIIKTYGQDRVWYDTEDHTTPHHLVTVEGLEEVYKAEINRPLTYYEQLDIMATILSTKYKGFGRTDTLREQNVDGINIGTSGSIISSFLDVDSDLPKTPRPIWIYYDGKHVHLDFLTTYTKEETRCIILFICTYNNPGSLTEKHGHMVSTTYDKTRVLAIRPGAGEYQAVFLRKSDIKNAMLEKLYCKPGTDPPTANILIELIKWSVIGRVICALTGRQGIGKTTVMIAVIAAIDARLAICTLEMAPEMYLCERYPGHNIYSVSEAQYVTAAGLQDTLKKSSAAVSIVSEAATDAIAARMIQMGQVVPLFTIFSHHANRIKGLINATTNSIVASNGGGATTATIQPQVINVIKINIRMDFDVTSFRYFERIMEITSADREIEPYNPEDPDSLAKIMREYSEITVVGELFTTQGIIRFDRETRSYAFVKWCPERFTEYMLENTPREQVEAFTESVMSNWKE